MRLRGSILSGALAIMLAVPAYGLNGVASIVLTKTVGTGAGCATTDNITVDFGTSVNYCYQVQNTGSVTLDTHTLVDDVLGILVGPNQMQALAPGQTRTEIFPFVVTTTTTNTATWTAMTTPVVTYTASRLVSRGNGPIVAMATDMATVNVPEEGDDACSDGEDNDQDMVIDCADSDCIGTAVCRAPAPVVGTTGLLVVALLLLLIGNVALVSRRRRS